MIFLPQNYMNLFCCCTYWLYLCCLQIYPYKTTCLEYKINIYMLVILQKLSKSICKKTHKGRQFTNFERTMIYKIKKGDNLPNLNVRLFTKRIFESFSTVHVSYFHIYFKIIKGKQFLWQRTKIIYESMDPLYLEFTYIINVVFFIYFLHVNLKYFQDLSGHGLFFSTVLLNIRCLYTSRLYDQVLNCSDQKEMFSLTLIFVVYMFLRLNL